MLRGSKPHISCSPLYLESHSVKKFTGVYPWGFGLAREESYPQNLNVDFTGI